MERRGLTKDNNTILLASHEIPNSLQTSFTRSKLVDYMLDLTDLLSMDIILCDVSPSDCKSDQYPQACPFARGPEIKFWPTHANIIPNFFICIHPLRTGIYISYFTEHFSVKGVNCQLICKFLKFNNNTD